MTDMHGNKVYTAKICHVRSHVLFLNIKTVGSTTKRKETEKFTNKTRCFVPTFK